MSYRFGKVYWDYDPCEDCNAEECESCEHFGGRSEDECMNVSIVESKP